MSLFCESFIKINFVSITIKLNSKNLNKTYSTELTNNRESSIETKYILTLDDFCFYYDIRSTLLDLIDRVIAIEEIPSLRIQQNPSTIIKYCLPPSNPIYRKKRKEKSSIAIQTSADFEQKRNAKVQANTLTLSPLRNYF